MNVDVQVAEHLAVALLAAKDSGRFGLLLFEVFDLQLFLIVVPRRKYLRRSLRRFPYFDQRSINIHVRFYRKVARKHRPWIMLLIRGFQRLRANFLESLLLLLSPFFPPRQEPLFILKHCKVLLKR